MTATLFGVGLSVRSIPRVRGLTPWLYAFTLFEDWRETIPEGCRRKATGESANPWTKPERPMRTLEEGDG